MFTFEEQSRDGKTFISNSAKDFSQMKKTLRKEIKCKPVVYDTFSVPRTMPMQFARESNPFYTPPEQAAGAPPLTGHHIIPFSLLIKLYGLLDPEQKDVIAKLAGADLASQSDRSVDDYIGWPQKNVFYGPDTSLRAEPGKKDDFDYDARFIIDEELFQSILATYEVLEKYKSKNRLNNGEKEIVYKALAKFYHLTAAEWPEPESEVSESEEEETMVEVQESEEEEAVSEVSESEEEFDPATLVGDSEPTALQSPAEYSPDDWQEIGTYEEIERIEKYRPSIKNYARFRLPLREGLEPGKSIPDYPEIGKNYYGGYTYTEEGKPPISIPNAKEEGLFLVFPLKMSRNFQSLLSYLKNKGAPTQTFLPVHLVSYINALDALQILRGEVKAMEESVQSAQEQIYQNLRWEPEYGAAPELQLDNKKLEEQVERLSGECVVMIADCTCIGTGCPDIAAGALALKGRAEELKSIFERDPNTM